MAQKEDGIVHLDFKQGENMEVIKKVVIETDPETGEQVEKEVEVQVFTQEEMNETIKERLARENKKNADAIEKAKKYDEYLEAQKTEDQKKAEALALKEKEVAELKERLAKQEQETILTKHNVIDADYIKFKAKELMNDTETTFEQAIETLKEKHPTFFRQTDKEANKETKKDEKVIIVKKQTNEGGKQLSYYEKKYGNRLPQK